ncbi:unnamed protein product [Gordionus sp. m RMFG-2023]|uniref:uncharacterized protein LOC135922156 n=1 Tax=Gordionus sp. m RMFG-2023 TaxID=3053472 RepID=UPI0030E167A7
MDDSSDDNESNSILKKQSVSSRAAHVKRRRNLSAESAETRLGHQNPRHDKGCNSRLVIDEDNDKSSVTSDDSEDDDIIAGKQPTKTKSKKLPLTVNDPLVGNKYSPKQKNVSNMPNHENRSSGGNRVNNKSLDKNGGSGKKGNGRSSWDCTICTFKNANNTFTCQMCDTRKGTSTRKPRLSTQTLAQQVSAAKSVNPITSALDSSGKVSSPSDLGKRVDFGAIDKSPRSPAIDKKTNEESKMGPNTSDAVIETSGGIVLPGCPSSQIKEKVKPKKVDRADNLVHKVGGQKEEKIIGKRKLSDNFHHSSPLIIPVTTADKSIKSPPTKKKDKKKPASTPDSALKPAQKNCKKVAVKTAPSPADINNNNLIINIDNNTTGKTKFPAKKRPKSEPNTNSIPIPKDDKNFAAATKKDKEPILSSTVNCDDFGGVGISNDNAASVKKRKGRKPGSCNKKKVAANSLLLLATSGHLMMGPNHSHNSSTSTDNICANPALRDDIFRSDNYCKEEPKIEEKSQSQHPQQSSKVGIVTPFIRNEHSTKSSTIHHSKKHRIISGQSAININKPPDLKDVNNFDPQPGNNPHPNYFPTTPPVILDLGAYDENKAKSPHSFLAKLMMTSSANRDTSSHATLVSSPQVPIASNHFDRFINSWKKLVTKNEEIQRSSNGNNSDNSHCAIGDERSVDLTAGHASNHAKTLQHLKYLEDHDPKYPCVNNINLPYSPDSFAYPNKKTNNVVSVNRDRTRHTPAVVKGTTDFSSFLQLL